MKTWAIALIAAAVVSTITITVVWVTRDDSDEVAVDNQVDKELQPVDEREGASGCYTEVDFSLLDDPWSYEEQPPACPAQSAPCDDGYYWNFLACKCFSMASCRLGCPEGQALNPLERCECVGQRDIDALYPSCATREEMQESVQQGMQAASERPDDWRICPREENWPESYCYGSGSYNELACSCFSQFQCALACPPPETLDPRSGCSCVDSTWLREDLYPSWATRYDTSQAYSAMWDHSERIMKLQVCPSWSWDVDTTCEEGFYWSELACKCFSLAQCFAPCPEGQFELPTEDCGCTEDEQEYLDLFPDWATREDIELAALYAIQALQ